MLHVQGSRLEHSTLCPRTLLVVHGHWTGKLLQLNKCCRTHRGSPSERLQVHMRTHHTNHHERLTYQRTSTPANT